ncbi:MAG: hypothetical protein ACON4H_18335 [Rubripirellula sp.]
MFDGQVSLRTLSLVGDVILALSDNRCIFPQVTVFSFIDSDKSQSILVGVSDSL